MLHYIDGNLMMVGVLDYTPACLSSVYLYYDPKYEFLSPGTLSALREIEHVRKLMTTGLMDERFKYYYMGLYF
jgi:arginyl-tRNA---protein transferase